MSLTAEQRTAVECPSALLVHAGAGAGKTSVLAHRIAHLVTTGSDPFEILAVTFSVKAARELRGRLEDLMPTEHARLVTVCTLHALGLRMLREYGDALGYVLHANQGSPCAGPEVCNGGWRIKLLTSLLEDTGVIGDPALVMLAKRLNPEEIEQAISAAKCAGIPPNTFAQRGSSPIHRLIATIYCAYEQKLIEANQVDFDGLILQPLCLLDISAEANQFFQARWQQVLVDECQDLSAAQYRLILRLVAQHRQLTLIGDASQSIYAFRGALGNQCFAQFQHDFPEGRVVHLPHNFRSTHCIVRLGDALLGHLQRVIQQVPMRRDSADLPVALLAQSSEHQEAGMVAREILRAVEAGFANFEHCAVLCRTNAQIGPLEQALLRAQVPYTVVGRGSFYDHREIRQLVACLRLSQNFDGDPHALQEITPVHGWLPQAVQTHLMGDQPDLLAEHVFEYERSVGLEGDALRKLHTLQTALLALDERKDMTPTDLLQYVLAEEGLAYRSHLSQTRGDGVIEALDRVSELLRMASGFTVITTFIDELDVLSGQNPLSTFGRDRVKVLTLHDAKGLEFRLVFLVGMEEGLIPHFNAQHAKHSLEEELRLAYVGFTRATDALCISFAKTRNGRRVNASPFLRGLPREIIAFSAPNWAGTLAASSVAQTANPLVVARPIPTLSETR